MPDNCRDSALVEAASRLITGLVTGIVEMKDAVEIKVLPDHVPITFLLRVSAADLERVYGPQGRTARSISTVLHALGVKQGLKYSLDIEPAVTSEVD